MKKLILIPILTIVVLLITGCSPQPAPTYTQISRDQLETMVAATLNAAGVAPAATATAFPPTLTPYPSLTPLPIAQPSPAITTTVNMPDYNVLGSVCFPDGDVPAMTLYFEDKGANKLVELPIAEGQTDYQVKLPPGTYRAYAWLPDFSRGGLYSNAVVCGMKETCTDHSARPFTVTELSMTEGVDICDWFAGPFDVPYPPNKQGTKATGSITGALSYPSGNTPGLRVTAFNLTTHNWYFVDTNPGWTTYNIPNLPPGSYQVVAYDENGRAGGHADANHKLIEIEVKSGEATSGADINDWTAPTGTFPQDPSR